MKRTSFIAIAMLCVTTPWYAAAQKPGRAAPAKAARQQANRTQVQAANQQARAAAQALNARRLPANLTLQHLAEMTPEERGTALSALPPARQANIERMVQNYLKEPPEQRAREQEQEKRIADLPAERGMRVRQSLLELRDTQPPRRGVIMLELSRLSGMTEEQRSTYMSKPAFRSRFSQPEIEMMESLKGIVP